MYFIIKGLRYEVGEVFMLLCCPTLMEILQNLTLTLTNDRLMRIWQSEVTPCDQALQPLLNLLYKSGLWTDMDGNAI